MAALALPIGRVSRQTPSALHVWLIGWILLPNLGFMGLWLCCAPPRMAPIAVFALAGLLARHTAYGWRLAAWVAAMAFAVIEYLAALFNGSIEAMASWVPFLVDLHPERSQTYILVAAGLLIIFGVAGYWLRRDSNFGSSNRNLMHVAAATLLMVSADYVVSHPTNAFYQRVPGAGAHFASGVGRSGFAASAAPGRHLLLVMVESLGLPRDPTMLPALFAPFREAGIRDRYRITQGTTPYYGTTVNGEMRALCGRWAGMAALAYSRDTACLPAVLGRRGYQTSAYHAFNSTLFDRNRVYPNMGFQNAMFREDLWRAGAGHCPGIFPGACDRDIPAIIARRLKSAGQPQFIYWLTLNSHLPVLADTALHTGNCPADAPDTARRFTMICRQFTLWRESVAALARELADPAMPPVDVLIVGDHMPPYFDWVERAQFNPAEVPWILLRANPVPAAKAPGDQNLAVSVTNNWRGGP